MATTKQRERRAALAIPAILLIGAGISWAGSDEGAQVAGIPVFALCGALSFAINTLGFLHASVRQTERYFDLVGSATYLCLIATGLVFGADLHPRSLLLGALVSIWALRLGAFLFARIRREGRDRRFDEIRTSALRFLAAWTLQGLWVLLTLASALAAITAIDRNALGYWTALGTFLWVLGFGFEVVADHQKKRFRSDPAKDDRFIASGLWAWSRHPNYFGEITLWIGIALIALPVLSGWRLITLISPVFVYDLLTRVSGIPPLEARGSEKWGEDPAYLDYQKRTPRLLPRPPRLLH